MAGEGWMTRQYDEWARTSYQPESGVGAHNPKQQPDTDAELLP